jgi:hypothetical protein
MEDNMRNRFSMAVVAAIMAAPAGALAEELPIFDLMGIPMTAHQFSVVGPAHVKERSPTPTLTLLGMPASPHQLSVLAPRARRQVAERLTNAVAQ